MQKHQYLLPIGILFIIAGILVFAITFFSGDETSPYEIATRTQASMYGLQSYRSEMMVAANTASGTIMSTQIHEYVAPNQYHAKHTNPDSWLEYIFIGEEQYYRASYGLEWQDNNVFGNKQIFVQISDDFRVLSTMLSVEKLSSEEIDGIKCYHLRDIQYPNIDIEAEVEKFTTMISENPEYISGTGSMNLDEIVDQYRSQVELASQTETVFDVWIGKEDYFLRQIRKVVTFPQARPDSDVTYETTTIVQKWYDFNQDIDISAPELGKNPDETGTAISTAMQ